MKLCLILGFLLVVASAGYAASCSSIDLRAFDVSLDEDSTDYFYFDVENNSNDDFRVTGVMVGDTSSKFDVSVSRYDEFIDEGETGEIKLKVNAFSVSSDYTKESYVKIQGKFDGGQTCSYSSIGTEFFDITIENGGGSQSCSQIEVEAENVTMDEDDVVFEDFKIINGEDNKFYIDGITVSESSSYAEIDVDDFDSFVNANDEADFTLRIESDNVSSDKTATVTVKVRGHFSGGASCSTSQTKSDSFTLRIENEGSGFSGSGYCSDLDIGVSKIEVARGETAEKNFTLENNANERFYVDYVDVYDNSGEFKAESNGYDKTVYSNSVGLIGVKVKAYSNAEFETEKAYISVRGHFQGGRTCSLEDSGKSFQVEVVEAEEEPEFEVPELPVYSDFCNGLILTVPSQKNLQESGIVSFSVENNTPYRATVRFSGIGLDTNPSLLSIPSGFKSDDYTVRVFSSKDSATLNYEIETFNCMAKKSTRIYSEAVATDDSDEGADQDDSAEEDEQEDGSLQAIAGTAFAVLGNNAVLGLLVIAIILLVYSLVLARRQGTVAVQHRK